VCKTQRYLHREAVEVSDTIYLEEIDDQDVNPSVRRILPESDKAE